MVALLYAHSGLLPGRGYTDIAGKPARTVYSREVLCQYDGVYSHDRSYALNREKQVVVPSDAFILADDGLHLGHCLSDLLRQVVQLRLFAAA